MSEASSLSVAIDGPAASGKGTLARQLAAHFGLAHLDTGLTYRAVAHALGQVGLPLDREDLAVAAAEVLDLGRLDRSVLADHAIGEAASRVAVMAGVRRVLVERQRAFARNPRGPDGRALAGAVLDGRDIGTVVLPDAGVKLYVTASAEVRAGRRCTEMTGEGRAATLDTVLADLRRRDERDMARADSPLRPAADAHLIDTSAMTIETAFELARSLVEAAR